MKLIDLGPEELQHAACVILADLHLHHLPDWRLNWCYEFVGELLELVHHCKKKWGPYLSVPDLILLGDAIEVKDKLDARVANLIIELLMCWPSRAYWVAGQHDSYMPYKATFHALHSADIIVVDDKPHEMPIGWWLVPYAREARIYREWLDMIPNDTIVLTHMPIKEVLDQFPGGAEEGWIRAKDFDRFGQIYSGDIHKECQYGKVEYIGAVSQRDWRDEGVSGCIATITRNGSFGRWDVMHPWHAKVKTKAQLKAIARKQPDGEVKTPYLVKLSGLNLTETELEKLRKSETIISAEVEPQPIEVIVGKANKDQYTELDPLQVMKDYLGSISFPEDALEDDYLLEVGKELLDKCGSNESK